MCVISAYNETSITKNIQYSTKWESYTLYKYYQELRKWYAKYNQKPTKWTWMDLHMTFDFALSELETNKSMKAKKTLKH